MHFKCGHHGQALWAASILGIHPALATMHIHPFKARSYSAYVHIKPSVSETFKRIISAIGDYFGKSSC